MVIALRSRTIPAADAVDQSLRALAWLEPPAPAASTSRSARRSTPPTRATSARWPTPWPTGSALVCPAFPANQRTVYAGHLFVGDQLLSDSPIRHHPLTPMTDPDLVAVLGRQSRRPVALVHLRHVRDGVAAVEQRIVDLAGAPNGRHLIADATADTDLDTLERAALSLGLPLCVGGSGLAGGIARALAPSSSGRPAIAAASPAAVHGPAVIVSGSCSATTGPRWPRSPTARPGSGSRPVAPPTGPGPGHVGQPQRPAGRRRRLPAHPDRGLAGLARRPSAQPPRPAGRPVAGDPPTKEWPLHLAVYDRRPDAGGVAHLHSTHAVAVSCLADVDPADVLPPLTAYYVMRVGRLPLVPYHPLGAPQLAGAVGSLAADHHAVLLANHGPVVAGRDLDEAVAAIEELEETARLHLLLDGQRTRPLTATQVGELRAADHRAR